MIKRCSVRTKYLFITAFSSSIIWWMLCHITCRLLHPEQLWIVTAHTESWDQSIHGRAVLHAKELLAFQLCLRNSWLWVLSTSPHMAFPSNSNTTFIKALIRPIILYIRPVPVMCDQLIESTSFIGHPEWVCTTWGQKVLAESSG